MAAATLMTQNVAAEAVKRDVADEYGEQALTGQSSTYCLAEFDKLAGGTLEITCQGGGAPGYKSVDHFDAVQDGAVQSAVTLLTQPGGIDPYFQSQLIAIYRQYTGTGLPTVADSPPGI